MGTLMDMSGNAIEHDPVFYKICIDIPGDTYRYEDVEAIAKILHNVLINEKVHHTDPEIMNLYA